MATKSFETKVFITICTTVHVSDAASYASMFACFRWHHFLHAYCYIPHFILPFFSLKLCMPAFSGSLIQPFCVFSLDVFSSIFSPVHPLIPPRYSFHLAPRFVCQLFSLSLRCRRYVTARNCASFWRTTGIRTSLL